MFHPESLAAVIHADRQREIEIQARNRRLLDAADAAEPVDVIRVSPVLPRPAVAASGIAKTTGRGGSACEAA